MAMGIFTSGRITPILDCTTHGRRLGFHALWCAGIILWSFAKKRKRLSVWREAAPHARHTIFQCMNITGTGIRRKAARDTLFGKPKGRARSVSGNAAKSVWVYRGIQFEGRRLVGWGAGREYIAENVAGGIGLSAFTKQELMVKIDWHLDGKPGGAR